MLGPASTDAVNRASRLSYGEATGITQTVRNYAASLGLAILGTILVSQLRSRLVTSLVARGLPHGRAVAEASTISAVPERERRRRPPSPISSGSTSPTPPARSSTSWPASWPWPPSWPLWGSKGRAGRSERAGYRLGRGRRRLTGPVPYDSDVAVGAGAGDRSPSHTISTMR